MPLKPAQNASACLTLLLMMMWGCADAADDAVAGGEAAEAAAGERIAVAAVDAPATADPRAPLDACELFTAADAAKLLGGSVGEPEQRFKYDGEPTQTAVMSNCGYTAAGSDRTLSVLVRRAREADNTPEAIEKTRQTVAEMASSAPTAVEGIGNTAFWTAGGFEQVELHAFDRGNYYVVASASGFETDEAALEHAKQAARLALERL